MPIDWHPLTGQHYNWLWAVNKLAIHWKSFSYKFEQVKSGTALEKFELLTLYYKVWNFELQSLWIIWEPSIQVVVVDEQHSEIFKKSEKVSKSYENFFKLF